MPQAVVEGLELTGEHWEVSRFLRDDYHEHGVQWEVRKMVKHFKLAWGGEAWKQLLSPSHFPRGGPQKQGNRLAGLLNT